MLVLRSMPDLSTPAARNEFHRRSREHGAFVCARVRHARYAPHIEELSLKAAFGGREDYVIDGDRRGVDDDVYLVINQDHEYESRLEAAEPVQSVAIVFPQAMRVSVLWCAQKSDEYLLDMPSETPLPDFEFEEHLRPHDRAVSPVLKFLARMCEQGFSEPGWYEEQAHFLLERLVGRGQVDRVEMEGLRFVRARTREEIYRRVHKASDFILTCYAEPMSLARLAAVACLARHHFLRMFKAVHGVTPFYYLNCKRVSVAARLLTQTSLTVPQIAKACGFGGRASLLRIFRELLCVTPSRFRSDAMKAGLTEATTTALNSLMSRQSGAGLAGGDFGPG